MRTTERSLALLAGCAVVGAGLLLAGCQAQREEVTDIPSRIIEWEDPETGVTGANIRDANNEEGRIVLIGTNGRVQFVSDGTVCNDCETEGATIDLGDGNLVDIRFGVGVVGDTNRRPFLVDRETGNFIQLVGGGDDPVTFQVTDTPLEDPNDPTDDLAIEAGDIANPTLESNSDSQSGLCGILGVTFPLTIGLLGLLTLRRR